MGFAEKLLPQDDGGVGGQHPGAGISIGHRSGLFPGQPQHVGWGGLALVGGFVDVRRGHVESQSELAEELAPPWRSGRENEPGLTH